jgi:probable HAF family extracellular repeat protein
MKSAKLLRIAAITLFAALAIPLGLAAQDNRDHHHRYHHYKLIDLGTFGGPHSYVAINNIQVSRILNSPGSIAGWADTSTPDPFPSFCFNSDCFVSHAFQSQNGVLTDLGVLPGGASSDSGWISANGLIAGTSENGLIDPLISGFPELRAVLWKHGEITDLGTLPEGGYESVGNAVNSRGQAAGAALNTVPDPNSMVGLGYQTRAFLWKNGVMQDLGTLGGTDAQAVLINESGQAAGWSYTNSTPTQASACTSNGFVLTTGSFLWDKGKGMVDVGTFGGTCTLAADLNNRGQVVGGSNLAGDLVTHPFRWHRGVLKDLGTLGGSWGFAAAINDPGEIAGYGPKHGDQVTHGFLWRDGVMTDLGTVDNDQCSYSFGINSKAQVLGFSLPTCSGSTVRASLWEDGGPMVDLNTLVPPGSALYLTIPSMINDRGEIAGVGVLSNGDQHAFQLIPCDDDHPGVEGCDYSLVDASATARISPAPIMQDSTTAGQNNPELRGEANPMLHRFGRRLAPWYRAVGGQKPNSMPISPPPTSTGEAGTPACTGIDDSNPDFGFHHYGHCEVDRYDSNKLTGYCFSNPYCQTRGTASCPRGKPAIRLGTDFCLGLSQVWVDVARKCSF